MSKKAIIFDICHFRNEDGPGIRTMIFFKGCPLRCLWCSNPFGLSKKPQLAVNFDRCTGCGNCVPVCPNAVNEVVEGKVKVDFAKCTACGNCVPVCPTAARKITGKEYTARELYLEVIKDTSFYRKNSGGVTLSGGEVLMQHEVAAETLRLCKTNYITTCIETSAFAPWEHLREVAQYCNFVFVDLKFMDSKRHKELVGVPNELILENIKKLCEFSVCRGIHVVVRTPIIPGYTDDEKNLIATAEFLATLPGKPELNLLPFHNMGKKKYEMVGRTYSMEEKRMLSYSDPIMLKAQKLCQLHAPENRVSIGGGEVDWEAV